MGSVDSMAGWIIVLKVAYHPDIGGRQSINAVDVSSLGQDVGLPGKVVGGGVQDAVVTAFAVAGRADLFVRLKQTASDEANYQQG